MCHYIIINGMKGRIGQPVQSVAGSTKKRYTPTQGKDGFFVPGVPSSVKHVPFVCCRADAPTTGIPQIHSFLGTSAFFFEFFTSRLLTRRISLIDTFANHSAAGKLAGFMNLAMQSKPAAVFFLTLTLIIGGRFTGGRKLYYLPPTSDRPPFFLLLGISSADGFAAYLNTRSFSCPLIFFWNFVREHNMTLTEHIKRIKELSSQSLDYVQAEKYHELISNLESIRSHAHSAISVYHDIMYQKENHQDFRDFI